MTQISLEFHNGWKEKWLDCQRIQRIYSVNLSLVLQLIYMYVVILRNLYRAYY